jgi:hypothetical protein
MDSAASVDLLRPLLADVRVQPAALADAVKRPLDAEQVGLPNGQAATPRAPA